MITATNYYEDAACSLEEDGVEYEITFKFHKTTSRFRYGEDADGNRGEWRTDTEVDVDAKSLKVYKTVKRAGKTKMVRLELEDEKALLERHPDLWEKMEDSV